MNNIFYTMKLFVTSVILILLSSCASGTFKGYSGVEKDRSDLAKIECKVERHGPAWQKLFISKVDGKSTFDFGASLGFSGSYPKSALVLSGRHYLQIRYEYAGSFSHGTIWFDAEAGKNYTVKSNTEGYSTTFWIIDDITGERIGGVPGGEPKKELTSSEGR